MPCVCVRFASVPGRCGPQPFTKPWLRKFPRVHGRNSTAGADDRFESRSPGAALEHHPGQTSTSKCPT